MRSKTTKPVTDLNPGTMLINGAGLVMLVLSIRSVRNDTLDDYYREVTYMYMFSSAPMIWPELYTTTGYIYNMVLLQDPSKQESESRGKK